MASTQLPPRTPDNREKLVDANHIFYHHDILDGFGHISLRNPDNPDTFFLTGQPAALITSPEIFAEYRVKDGKLVKDATFVSEYSEHYIHAAILAKFPGVNSVVHSHARDVLPFGVTMGFGEQARSSLRPLVHTAGFLSEHVPCWNIGGAYSSEHEHSKRHLLVNDYTLGASLAAAADKPYGQYPYHKAVLQRGHGFVALGDSIEEAVYNAIYTVENARVQVQAEQRSSLPAGQPVQFLTPAEIEACAPMDRDCIMTVWPLWMAETKSNPLWQRHASVMLGCFVQDISLPDLSGAKAVGFTYSGDIGFCTLLFQPLQKRNSARIEMVVVNPPYQQLQYHHNHLFDVLIVASELVSLYLCCDPL